MKWMFAAVFAAAIAIASAPGVEAKGCIKGAIVGGAAGHMAGHGKLGAAAGCVVGHHEANKPETSRTPRRLRVRSEAMAKLMEGLVRRVAADSARPDWTLLAASELASAAIVLFFRSMFSV